MPALSNPIARLALPLGLMALAVPLLAQIPKEAPGTPDKSRIVAGTYVADPAHSLIAWRISHMGFNDYFGLIGGVTGTLVLDPAHPEAARVSASIPVGKITTVNAALTGQLLKAAPPGGKPQFFGESPPAATFVSTGVVPRPDGASAVVSGNLTLNGVTRPVRFDARFVGAGPAMLTKTPTVGFHGQASINRSDFGMDSYIPVIGDRVDLEITMAFEKKR